MIALTCFVIAIGCLFGGAVGPGLAFALVGFLLWERE